MADLSAPGVYTNITDQTFARSGVRTVGTAIVGPTPSGPPMVPTIVTSYEEYKANFGTAFVSGSYYYEYLTSIAARNYFDNGGDTLLVTRIVSGSGATMKTYASASVATSGSTSVSAFTLALQDFGSAYNGSTTQFGRKWEISSVNTQLGTFSINIRRGDDTDTNKIILESWNNLALDPQLPNYISRTIGDTVTYYDSVTNTVKSEGGTENKGTYITVKTVDSPLIDSLDANGLLKSAYLSKLPIAGTSGSFAGGTDGVVFAGEATLFEKITGSPSNVQGYTATPYVQALDLLSNKLEYDFKVLLLPGISPDNANMSTVIASLSSLMQTRKDAVAILDTTTFGATPAAAISAISSLDNSYLAAYYPWGQTYSLELGRNVWVSPSTVMGGVYKFNDSVSNVWFAPAGFNRGGIPSLSKTERKLTQDEIALLYNAGVNPLATFPNVGIVAWAQNTLQKRISHLRKVSIQRLVIDVKRQAEDIAKYLIYEPNTIALRNKFKAQLTPYLESVAQKQGLYNFRIIMDETNNTSEVIDRYELRGQIIIQPTVAVEIILLNITVAATGVDISQ